MALESYRNLKVWQLGMDIAEECYSLTRSFPREELFGMSSQIRRSAASVPANVAEGYARAKRGEYVHFLYIAHGSLKELETHLILAVRVGIASEASVSSILSACDEEGKMLAAQIRRLESPTNAAK